MADIVISEFMDQAAIDDVLAGRDVLYDATLVDKPKALCDALGDARALIVRNRTQVDGNLLDAAPRLRTVGRLGVGLDNIDLDACRARNVSVRPATGANDAAVAEYVITAALILMRGAWLGAEAVRAGDWPRMAMIGREIAGKRLGLVGFGGIARQTAFRALALGMEVAAFDPYLAVDDPAWKDVLNLPLGELVQTADVLSLHVPFTDETHHLIDRETLAGMKHDAVLINAARGGVVDEVAVAEALRGGRLGGAAFDVFECEPVSADSGRHFDGLENLLLTPHIAGVTVESNVRVSRVTALNVLADLG